MQTQETKSLQQAANPMSFDRPDFSKMHHVNVFFNIK